jgi:hypothetical protein
MRVINVAAAQLGPIQKAESREAVVKRMIATEMSLLPQARAASTQPTLRLTFTSARAKRCRSAIDDGSCNDDVLDPVTECCDHRQHEKRKDHQQGQQA